MLTGMHRVPPSRILRYRDYLAPLHHPIAKQQRCRSLSPSYLSLCGKDSVDIGPGICQPAEAYSTASVLVFCLEDQLCTDRYLWQPPARHSARPRRSRVLQVQTGGVSVDLERGQQKCSISGFLRQVAGYVLQFPAELDREAIGVDS